MVTVPSEWVLGVAALVIVLTTINLTCLVMHRAHGKAQSVDFADMAA